jgi:hypothetical protein
MEMMLLSKVHTQSWNKYFKSSILVSPCDAQPDLITLMPAHVFYLFFLKDVSDEGNRMEENESAKTGGNTADGEEETNVVSGHRDEQEQVIFLSF